MFVTDFADHVRHMEGFHRRWMGSAAARDAWVAMVSKLKIDILAPQHGLMFRGDDVKRFIDWFAGLEVGTGVSVLRNAAR
jgi:flavorubredoxin